ncbi:MAG: hypothetical protein J6S54_08155 [Lentisphaeria bacterium]|nr:hypothetical protein [Lentisphaeria bacterium]
MKKNLFAVIISVLILGSGCATSTLKWIPAQPGEKSSSGNKVVWDLEAVNNGIYLFYCIPIVCGHTWRPNRFDYQFFLHWINEKHALRLLNCRNKALKVDDVEDVAVVYKSNGWPGLGIIWSRSFMARGKAVKKSQK